MTYLPFQVLVFLKQNSSSLLSSKQPSAWPHWPGLDAIQARSLKLALLELLLQKTADLGILFPFITVLLSFL
jgi:hypothetical protein